jgi:hypothetical protein
MPYKIVPVLFITKTAGYKPSVVPAEEKEYNTFGVPPPTGTEKMHPFKFAPPYNVEPYNVEPYCTIEYGVWPVVVPLKEANTVSLIY